MALSRQSMRAAGVARLVLAELPEGLALTDPAAAVHPLRDRRGDPLGGDQQRRQRGRGLLGPVAQRAPARARGASAIRCRAAIGSRLTGTAPPSAR